MDDAIKDALALLPSLKRAARKFNEDMLGNKTYVLGKDDVDAFIAALEALEAAERLSAWTFCPECGSNETYNHNGNQRFCEKCGQDWWTDVNYLPAIQKKLARLSASPASVVPKPIAEAPHFQEVLVYRKDAGWFTAEYTNSRAEEDDGISEFSGEPYWFDLSGDDLTTDMPTHFILFEDLPVPDALPAPSIDVRDEVLVRALKRIDAINDNPAHFNSEINDVIQTALKSRSLTQEKVEPTASSQ